MRSESSGGARKPRTAPIRPTLTRSPRTGSHCLAAENEPPRLPLAGEGGREAAGRGAAGQSADARRSEPSPGASRLSSRKRERVSDHGPNSRRSRATGVSGPTEIRAASGWSGLTTTLASRPAVTTDGTISRADLRLSIQSRPKAWATERSPRSSQPGCEAGTNASRETSSGTTASTHRAALGGDFRLAWTRTSNRHRAKLVPV